MDGDDFHSPFDFLSFYNDEDAGKMKWGIISPTSKHFQNKMQWAFEGRDCMYSSRTGKTVKVLDREVQTVAFNEMLEQVDSVYVCTPSETHFGIVRKCLKKGKDVLCEKPLCMDVKEFKILRELATKKQKKLGMVFQPFFKSAIPMLANIGQSNIPQMKGLKEGEAVFTIQLHQENLVFDVGIYPAMYAVLLSGDIDWNNTCFETFGAVDIARLLFKNKQQWFLKCSDNFPFEQRVTLIGDDWTLNIDKPFTDEPKSHIYNDVVDDFEHGFLFDRAVELFGSSLELLCKWRDFCDENA